jgi:hypothetical protein
MLWVVCLGVQALRVTGEAPLQREVASFTLGFAFLKAAKSVPEGEAACLKMIGKAQKASKEGLITQRSLLSTAAKDKD